MTIENSSTATTKSSEPLSEYEIRSGSAYRVECLGGQANGYWWHASDVDVSVFQDTDIVDDGRPFYAWNGSTDDHDEAEKTRAYATIDEAIGAAIAIHNAKIDEADDADGDGEEA